MNTRSLIRLATLLVMLILIYVPPTLAQDVFPNTLTLDSLESSPNASLDEMAWIEGHWRGEALGGITEEVWSPPLGGSIMGVFRLVAGDEVRFYEIITITEEEESLMLRLKHFHRDLKGWEEKDETVDFPLVKIKENRAYFDGFTFERVNADSMNIYLIIGPEDNRREVTFPYRKVD